MNIQHMIEALEAAEKADIPTTRKAAQKLHDSLKPHLDELTELLDTVRDELEAVDSAVDEIAEVESKQDREDLFETLDGACYDLRQTLAGLST